MRIFLTGASGNIGSHTLQHLLSQGHEVTCLLRKSKRNEQLASSFENRVSISWGEMTQREVVKGALASANPEVIVHLAAIIPPQLYDNLEMARAVNVEGTRAIIETAQTLPQQPKILYSSTFDVFGHTQDQPPPRRVDDPVEATDEYTRQKLLCEQLLKDSGLEWAIYRFSDIPPVHEPRGAHPIMYSIPLSTRLEILHPDDAGLAIANGVTRPIWGKIWLIGGGPQCQTTYGEYIGRQMESAGIGRLPEAAFTQQQFCCDWLDTSESQQLLQYQRHTFDEIIIELARISAPRGINKLLVAFLRPVIRRSLLKMSPYIGEHTRQEGGYA